MNRLKETEEKLDETIEGDKEIPSIQEQLLSMQDFSDDDDDKEEEDRMQEFEEKIAVTLP